MSYEIIVLDIDGTLVNSKKEITDRTLKTLTKLHIQIHINPPYFLMSDIPYLLLQGMRDSY